MTTQENTNQQVVELELSAHAKINLGLVVGAARADGFHELATVFAAIDLSDRLVVKTRDEFTDVPGHTVGSLSVSGPYSAGVPTDGSNLVVRAVNTVSESYAATGCTRFPVVDLELEKFIPAAGGMAGGSADAAAAIVGADRVFGALHPGSEAADAHAIACRLGSDIAFCLRGGVAIGRGRGNDLDPIDAVPSHIVVVAAIAHSLSTPRVFARFDELVAQGHHRGSDPVIIDSIAAALKSGDVAAVSDEMVNDLEVAATSLFPPLAGVMDAGRKAGAQHAMVSGSGPTCLFLCDSLRKAANVASAVAACDCVTNASVHTFPAPGVTWSGVSPRNPANKPRGKSL